MKETKMITLDIGCGNNKTNGTIGLDRVRTDGVDILCDIEQSLPLKSGTIDKIIASHVLEHMGNVIKTLEEIHRVLKMGGVAIIEVPHVRSLGAFMDPTHKHFFTIMTMDYFTDESAFNYYSHARFRIMRKELKFKPRWLQWLFNLRPEFTEQLLGIVPVKANIYWVLEKSVAGKMHE
ncbi:MAG: methyltransferase domain-containing protein [Bacteroidales bacterium]|nr:methyltransferase domain-containing protein [Bacteroidales bacterium]